MAAPVFAMVALAACSAQTRELPRFVDVPFVGCASDGQAGPQEPPFGTTTRAWLTQREAERLAYYSTGDMGVLAPRGWHCFGLYGSSGSGLHVGPTPFRGRQLFSDEWAGLPDE